MNCYVTSENSQLRVRLEQPLISPPWGGGPKQGRTFSKSSFTGVGLQVGFWEELVLPVFLFYYPSIPVHCFQKPIVTCILPAFYRHYNSTSAFSFKFSGLHVEVGSLWLSGNRLDQWDCHQAQHKLFSVNHQSAQECKWRSELRKLFKKCLESQGLLHQHVLCKTGFFQAKHGKN